MKLKKLFGNWSNAIKTFPVSHILLLAISVLLIGEIYGSFDDTSNTLLIALSFAFLLSCLGPIFLVHSNLKNKNTINWILQVSSIVLGAIYYFLLTRIDKLFDTTYSESLIYFGILLLAGLSIPLLIAILHKKEENKIWFSWTSLLISLIFGGIAGSIVRGGIAGAFGSIEALFDVNIKSERYGYIGVLSEILLAGSFVFNYYLTLVESINNKSEFKIEPSRIRRIFGSFIFLPLAIIYLLIFGAYGIKILVTGVWPRGIIVRLGIGYFVLGTISLDMNYPDKTKTHEIINKILYISFILIALMMIGAIYQRINQYGITINRWLICYVIAFIIIFSALSLILKNKRLLSFVSTLLILALLALYGPLSASNISFKSQTNRLATLLSKENISLPLTEGALENVDKDQTRLILGTIDELTQNYNSDKVVDKIISYDYSGKYRYSTRSEIRNYLKVDENYDYYDKDEYFNYRQSGEDEKRLDVKGFSKLYNFSLYDEQIQGYTIKINTNEEKYTIDLSEFVDELVKKSDSDNRENPALTIDTENYRLVISGFYGRKSYNQEPNFNNVQGYILVK